MKPTDWLGTIPEVLLDAPRTCSNGDDITQWHRHVSLVDGRTGPIQMLPLTVSTARVLRGLRNHATHV